jgi:putative membrane protein
MDGYLWFKALHVMSVLAWMAGLFYMPRLFVYHSQQAAASATSETFKVMEAKLMRIIMNPAMVSSWLFGLLTAWKLDAWTAGWFHVKLLMVLAMTGFHLMLARWSRDFAADANRHPERFYRIANEVPTLLMMVIVVMAVVKPF